VAAGGSKLAGPPSKVGDAEAAETRGEPKPEGAVTDEQLAMIIDIIVQKAFKQATGDKRATHISFEHFVKVLQLCGSDFSQRIGIAFV